MIGNGWIWGCDHSIASELSCGRRILDELLEQLTARQWSRHDCFAVHLAAEEALVNAIRHGNGQDPKKRVQISCRLREDVVRIEIGDEGPGFDIQAVPDPTAADRLAVPGGRGLALMKAFMSHVEYSHRGRRVTLVKRRSRPCDERCEKSSEA